MGYTFSRAGELERHAFGEILGRVVVSRRGEVRLGANSVVLEDLPGTGGRSGYEDVTVGTKVGIAAGGVGPAAPPDDDSRTKALGEVAGREAAVGREIELVILWPGQVHGPRSRMWTETMCRMVAEGRPLLIGDGSGRVHPVYVGNLVDALLLAAMTPEAAGEAFNVVEESVTWRDFLGHYAGLTGVGLESIPACFARALSGSGRSPASPRP